MWLEVITTMSLPVWSSRTVREGREQTGRRVWCRRWRWSCRQPWPAMTPTPVSYMECSRQQCRCLSRSGSRYGRQGSCRRMTSARATFGQALWRVETITTTSASRVDPFTYTRARTHTRARMHAHTHARHTHTHTHTHTFTKSGSLMFESGYKLAYKPWFQFTY